MTRFFMIATLTLVTGTVAPAQRGVQSGIPADAASAIASLYNASDTWRESGAVEIGRDSVVLGTLAVRGGPVVIAGHVTGSLVVINGDLTFRSGARVDGQVYVVGGTVTGRDLAQIGNDYRAYAETLRYRIEGDALVVSDERDGRDEPAARRARARERSEDEFWRIGHRTEGASFDFLTIAGSGTYNRVEGLPVLVGPRLSVRRDWGSYMVQARAIVRLVEPMEWNRGTLGHDARTEYRRGTEAGVGIGAGAFDRIDPVEGWQMPSNEVGYAAFGIHRDFRDYYSRHGAHGYVTMYAAENSWIRAGYGEERWESRSERDAWSLFYSGDPWRVNPAIDEGRAKIVRGSLNVDTRNQRFSPGAGWYIQADMSREQFEPVAAQPIREYTRGFVDVRRYNRLAPRAQLNVRAVVGGWLNGDALPLSRRLSVSGPGTLPGFDFRRHRGGDDRLQCSEGGEAVGLPAWCDRVALLQAEYRGALSWSTRTDESSEWMPFDIDTPTWVVFADAGRGWRAKDDGVTTSAIESFPALRTFKTDLGIGLDFGTLSIAVAKSVSDKAEPANLVIRLARRF